MANNGWCSACGQDSFYGTPPSCDWCGFELEEPDQEDDEPPYSIEDYEKAKNMGLDLDDWDDYAKFYGLGEGVNYDEL